MVAFPDSSTEPALLNVTDIKLNTCVDHNDERLTGEPNDLKVKDHAFTIQRANMSNGKDNYALDFDCMEKADEKKMNAANNIKVQPEVVKKVAGELAPREYAHLGLKVVEIQAPVLYRDRESLPTYVSSYRVDKTSLNMIG